MCKSLRAVFAALVAAVLSSGHLADAQDEFHVASIDAATASLSDAGTSNLATNSPYCDDCATPHWYAGAEAVFLRPYGSEDIFTHPTTDIGFKTGYRFWFGREFDDGLGARIRWFDYQGAEGVGVDRRAAEFQAMDLELTQVSCLDTWTFQMSGGFRYAEANVVLGTLESALSGGGLTLGVEGVRPLRRFENLNFVIGGRWSGIFGNSRIFVDGALADVDRDDLASILEIYLGPQYRRELDNGSMWILGANVETQNWNNGFGFDTQDIGLFGFTMNAAYMW